MKTKLKVGDCVFHEANVVIIIRMDGDKVIEVGGPIVNTTGHYGLDVYPMSQDGLQITYLFNADINKAEGMWKERTGQRESFNLKYIWRELMDNIDKEDCNSRELWRMLHKEIYPGW